MTEPLIFPEKPAYAFINAAQFNSRQQEGYEVKQQKESYLYGSAGTRYVLQKYHGNLGCRCIKPIVGCITFPFICCCFCTIGRLFKSLGCSEAHGKIDHACGWNTDLLCDGCDEYDTVYRFLPDSDKTTILKKQDFQQMGFNEDINEAIKEIARSDKFPLIQSEKFPQHYYKTFFGPVSKFSCILLVPSGQIDGDIRCFCVFDPKSGKPLNAFGLKQRAEKLCGGYQPGMKRVTTVQKRVLIHETEGGAVGFSPFGGAVVITGSSQTYQVQEEIVTT